MRPVPAREPARGRRSLRLTALAAGVALLSAGCDARGLYEDAFSLGFPDPVTDQGKRIYDLWLGSVAAAAVVGVFVWGLIFFAVVRYRKRGEELPRQVRYNLPVEVLYTVVPFVIIAVLFYYTAISENYVNKLTKDPKVTIGVVGFQWNWQFNYQDEKLQVTGAPGAAGPAGPADRPHHPLRRDLARRHPLVLGAGVPVQARRDPGAHQHLRDHHPPGGHVDRPLRRALR